MTLRRATRRTATLASLTVASGLALAAPSQANHQTVTGLTTANTIVQFAVGTPGTLISGPTAITGLSGGEDLLGLDYRPRTGTLYAQGASGQVYLLSPGATFAATAIGTPTGNPDDVATAFDFNPVPDAIRVSNVNDQNFRFSPNTGALLDGNPGTAGVQPDANLAFAAGHDANAGDDPDVGAGAYTNNFDGALVTTLFDIEAGNNALVRQGGADGIPSPNAGALATVGTLPGGDITPVAGFDIETQTNNAYAALQTTGQTSSIFYRLDLTNGAALNTFGPIAGGALVESVSLLPIPQLQFASAVTSTREGTAATVTVDRQGPVNQRATVNYTTEVAAGDNAQADDFTPTSGTLTFVPGDSQESFTVPTTGDAADEADETFTVRLSLPDPSVNLPAPPTTKVNVVDDDDAPRPPTNYPLPVPPGKPGAAPFGLISVPTQRIDRTIVARFICDDPCTARLDLRLGRRVLDRRTVVQKGFGSKKVTFRLSRREVRLVKRAARGRRSAKLKINGRFSDADGSTRSSVRFQLG